MDRIITFFDNLHTILPKDEAKEAKKIKHMVLFGEGIDTIQWSFDLTEYHSPYQFETLLMLLGFRDKKPTYITCSEAYSEEEGKRVEALSGGFWRWRNDNITIDTKCDPISGKFTPGISDDPDRCEPGYASYMGVKGKFNHVNLFVAYTRITATIKDEAVGSRWY